MKINFNSTPPLNIKSDLIIIPFYQDHIKSKLFPQLNEALGLKLIDEAKKEGFTAKEGSQFHLGPFKKFQYRRILLLGLGKREKKNSENSESFLSLGGQILTQSQKFKAEKVTLTLLDEKTSLHDLYQIVLSAQLKDYKFDKYQKKKEKTQKISLQICFSGLLTGKHREISTRTELIREGVFVARDLINSPACEIFPQTLANTAKQISRKSSRVKVKIMDERQIKREKMNLFLAVGSGSTAHPPRFIHMKYTPAVNKAKKRKIFIIGKGVTFDSGGLSLKPATSMMNMKIDMSGSAAVLGLMTIIQRLKPSIEINALIAATENMPDGNSIRPGDIIQSRQGKYVEILNTDAEGRLTLADALTYAKDKGASEIVDLATLTGACMIALGPYTAGLFSNRDDLAEQLKKAGTLHGEDFWRLPLTPKLKKSIKSDVADLKNIGPRYGGAITAALFIESFAEKTPWMHLDIAGPAFMEENGSSYPKGGRGFGVSTLVEYLCPLKSI